MFSRTHLLLILPFFLLPSCQPEKKKAKPTASTKEPAGQPEVPGTTLGEGIVVAFPHKILLDVTTGSNSRITRKILIQTMGQPADDARRQLKNSLELVGFKRIGGKMGAASEIGVWTKDGKPMEETIYGISVQTTPMADPREPAATGVIGIDINRAAN